ncbi:hypothetical protein ACE38W_01820 [Chitinophaga sp. Hz27]|uniref:hypothetical protein n=1 Tax=Chitinophaga sp. Hz27 TaxID=3347169 RepID=UPI0035DF1135
MKKLFLLALIFSAAIYACNKQSETSKDKQQPALDNTNRIGALHNTGLSIILDKAEKEARKNVLSNSRVGDNSVGPITVPGSNPYDVSTASIFEDAKALVLKDPAYQNLQLTIDAATLAYTDQVLNSFSQNSIKTKWAESVNQQAIVDKVSTRERGMVGEITTVFNTAIASNAGIQANYLSVKSQLAAIRQKYKNTVLLPNEGELFWGVLSIAESSNEYWSTEGASYVNAVIKYDSMNYKAGNPYSLVTDPLRSQAPFLTADCLGYLIGWTKAVVDENSANGGLSIKNEDKRIGAGLGLALTFSGGSLLRTMKRMVLSPVNISKDSLLIHMDTIINHPTFPKP